MAENMQHWTPRPRPEAVPLEGRYVRLEKLEPRHADQLYDASTVTDADARFTWLPEMPPQDRDGFAAWVEKVSGSSDPLFFAIIDKATGKVAGRQTLMRID
ncbi:MAG: GNAT family N-acetyltransferase, partial [Cypionkella sp.]|nr:GNAT family N-acetyltransferase [Cypionkella sp.]